jgi:hypothetical protein
MHLLINASLIVWAIAGGYHVVDVIQLRKENEVKQALDAAKEKALESSASAGDTLAATLPDDAGRDPDDDLDKSAREAQEVRDSAKKKEEDLKEARVTICLGLYGALVCLMPRPSMKSTYEEALNSNEIIRNRQRSAQIHAMVGSMMREASGTSHHHLRIRIELRKPRKRLLQVRMSPSSS